MRVCPKKYERERPLSLVGPCPSYKKGSLWYSPIHLKTKEVQT